MRKVALALLLSDTHLTLKAPVARAQEPNWLKAQERMLDQVIVLATKHDVDVLCAGDLFEKWSVTPELINWAIDRVPYMIAVPGQHDLPNHSLDLIKKSAYWTLVKAGKIKDLATTTDGHMLRRGCFVQGFPWGVPIEAPPKGNKLNVALVHKYIWMEGKSFPGANKDRHIRRQRKALKGWDVVCYGDNHKGFMATCGETTVFNCGGFQRRKADEIGYKPQVGILYSDGSVKRHHLDCSHDIITEAVASKAAEEDVGFTEFLEGLTKLADSKLDFVDAMKQVLEEKKPRKAVRNAILEAME